MNTRPGLSLLVLCCLTGPLLAQQPRGGPASPPQLERALSIDSGFLGVQGEQGGVVFRRTIRVDGARWLQLRLGRECHLPIGGQLRLRAATDGLCQLFDQRALEDYQHWSAGFDGDELTIELWLPGDGQAGRVVVAAVIAGGVPAAPESLCGYGDRRQPSADDRQGRLFVGCTGWLIGEDLMLTAGHCITGAAPIVEFEVPASLSDGSIRRALPEDQYPFVVLAEQNVGIGEDWALCRILPNSDTGLLPTDRNGRRWYRLGDPGTAVIGSSLRITGYGTTNPPDDRNQTQQTHLGTLQAVASTALCYAVDTSGGNSGSPVIDEAGGRAIAVHTNGGCDSLLGCNRGTRIDQPSLRAAIQSAQDAPGHFERFGQGCDGSGRPIEICAGINEAGGALAGFESINEYAYGIQLDAELEVGAVELWTESSTGRPETLACAIHGAVDGLPSATPLATGTIRIGTDPGFHRGELESLVRLGPGPLFLVVDHSASTSIVSHLATGSISQAFWRRPAGSGPWSVSSFISRPAFRLLCPAAEDTVSMPTTGLRGEPSLGEGYGITLESAVAGGLAYLLTGFSDQRWGAWDLPYGMDGFGAPGCELLVEPFSILTRGTSVLGSASFDLQVPNNRDLIGLRLFHQWVVIDPGSNRLGASFSAGGRVQIGT